jgi:hypothetical protein
VDLRNLTGPWICFALFTSPLNQPEPRTHDFRKAADLGKALLKIAQNCSRDVLQGDGFRNPAPGAMFIMSGHRTSNKIPSEIRFSSRMIGSTEGALMKNTADSPDALTQALWAAIFSRNQA